MPDSLPLVSVLAANYNNSKFVLDCLESIRMQSYDHLELIIVDDGSTDGSDKIIRNWLSTFQKPYKFIVHDKNEGLCKTCNDLVENASGKYISLIATDDMYLPNKITNQVKVIEELEGDVAMIYTDVFLIDNLGNRTGDSYMTKLNPIPFNYIPTGNVLNELQHLNFIHGLSILIKREVYSQVGLYDEKLLFEDYDMSLRIAKRYKVVFSNDVQSLYRVHDTSFSGKTKNWEELLLPIYLKHSELPIFRQNAEAIIWREYFARNKNVKNWIRQLYQVTNVKPKSYFFILNNIPPLFLKAFNRISACF